MYYVNWDECQEFCGKAGLRLPTEAEWEYACRAGSTGPYAGSGDLDEMGWYGGKEGENHAHRVGKLAPNDWGLYDMHGNVWEWCSDWYDRASYTYYIDGEEYKESPSTDPKGPPTGEGRVVRGGAYSFSSASCRSAKRGVAPPDFRNIEIGFRPVLRLD